MTRARWGEEPKYRTRALAPLRLGSAGQRRDAARRMLLRLMGFLPEQMAEFPAPRVPSHFGRNRLSRSEAVESAIVAQDHLRELGYDAAADALRPASPDYLDGDAREALATLEAGPPSIWLDRYLVYKKPMYKFDVGGRRYIIARAVRESSLPWYRFRVGRAVHSQRGDWIGWDGDAGHTFQRRARSLKEARAALYGTEQL